MGSEKYPFKGFLDVIANRCFASGTNAWTDQDHTAYTMETVIKLGNVACQNFDRCRRGGSEMFENHLLH